MPRRRALYRSVVALVLASLGCEAPLAPSGTYYDREIAPALSGCQVALSGCHVANEEGSAPGNLDLSSYDALRRRTDLLIPYGPYATPQLLLKTGDPETLVVDVHDPPESSRPDIRSVDVTTDFRHAAGRGLPAGSRARSVLQRWLAEGFDRNGAVRLEPSSDNRGACAEGPGEAPGFSVEETPQEGLFDAFRTDVQPVLGTRCGGGDCHGAPLADFHLACGDTEEEARWNFWIATRFLGEPVERSELLSKPLAPSEGGSFHTGGATFADTSDAGYRTLEAFARRVSEEAPSLLREDDVTDGYRFFVNRVQPTFVRKGCMTLACHSPLSVAFNLRGGSSGSFSRFSRRINYEKALHFLALESGDADQSRIIAKNLHPPEMGGRGIAHRGGGLFEDGAGSAMNPAACASFDAATDPLDEVPAYCVVRRWHAIERAARVDSGELTPELTTVVFVRRPPGIGGHTAFHRYRPGADLVASEARAVGGALELGPERSLLEACALSPATADVRRPRPSWDGTSLFFAARSSADEPLRLHELSFITGRCDRVDTLAGAERVEELLVHDFDPSPAPDGSVVFASTRGDAHGGPTRTAARLEPNADLYVLSADRSSVRQLTFLLDQELAPGFLADGRVIYTVEKRALDFHALALRRQNLDGGDYHPLYASRPSLGFDAAVDVSVLPNGNGLFLASALDATDGVGSVAMFNRSLGPDQEGREERGYLGSLTLLARSALHGGSGLYRSPTPLPSGRVLVSCADGDEPPAAPVDFDLCEIDPISGQVRHLGGSAGQAEVDAVAIFARPQRGVVASNGMGERPLVVAGADDALVRFNDFPLIASLMFSNTREGRPIDPRIGGFEVLAHTPPPRSLGELSGPGVIHDSRGAFYSAPRSLGWVPLHADGSTSFRLRGGQPISFALTDGAGLPLAMSPESPFEGEAVQREHEQYYPGERIVRSIPRRFFNTACGSCHGSLTGRELDIHIDVDIVSGASRTQAREAEPHDLR